MQLFIRSLAEVKYESINIAIANTILIAPGRLGDLNKIADSNSVWQSRLI